MPLPLIPIAASLVLGGGIGVAVGRATVERANDPDARHVVLQDRGYTIHITEQLESDVAGPDRWRWSIGGKASGGEPTKVAAIIAATHWVTANPIVAVIGPAPKTKGPLPLPPAPTPTPDVDPGDTAKLPALSMPMPVDPLENPHSLLVRHGMTYRPSSNTLSVSSLPRFVKASFGVFDPLGQDGLGVLSEVISNLLPEIGSDELQVTGLRIMAVDGSRYSVLDVAARIEELQEELRSEDTPDDVRLGASDILAEAIFDARQEDGAPAVAYRGRMIFVRPTLNSLFRWMIQFNDGPVSLSDETFGTRSEAGAAAQAAIDAFDTTVG